MKRQNCELGQIDQSSRASGLELSLDAGDTETILAGAIAQASSSAKGATGLRRGPHFSRTSGSEDGNGWR